MVLTLYTVLYAVSMVFAYWLYNRLTATSSPASIPWIDLRDEWFAKTRAHIREVKNGRQNLVDGYFKYSKKGKMFISPSINFREEIILPPKDIEWLDHQPEHILSAKATQVDFISGHYTSWAPRMYEDMLHATVVRTTLTRKIQFVQPLVIEELKLALQKVWGEDEENWKEVNVYDTMMYLVTRTSNRMFVGVPLCRNEDYLAAAQGYAVSVATVGTIIRLMVPKLLKPILGPLVAIPVHLAHSRGTNHLIPFIKERLAKIEKGVDEDWNDFLQWLIDFVQKHPDPVEGQPETLAARMMQMNFGAIHTSTFTITNALFDIVSSPPEKEFHKILRKEADDILGSDFATWTKPTIAKLTLTDSALRESLRFSGVTGKSLMRQVMVKNGIDLPDGTHVPYGTRLAVAGSGAHMDPDVYEHPTEYRAFRFAEAKERLSEAESSGTTTRTEEILKARNLSMVTTGPAYTPFGHGRHACPGRFFAAQEIKILLAYIMQQYDIEPLPTRPPSFLMSDSAAPPMKATIRVRKRKSAANL